MIVVITLLVVAGACLIIPAAVLVAEIASALLAGHSAEVQGSDCPTNIRIAVMVPAHNEGSGLLPTLNDIKHQLRTNDRVLVIADNCTDDTASVAASAGAEVAIRSDALKIGKGYALDWGMKYLSSAPPDVVIIIDADCRVQPNAIDRLAYVCQKLNRPAQALYLMTSLPESAINHQVAEFAWRLKNLVRPLGLRALGLPCQLMGTGMAFPWSVIQLADLANGSIVEDLKLGLELASAGYPPKFEPLAVVTSTFPATAQGSESQRHRWEQGHIQLIKNQLPKLMWQACRNANLGLLALLVDLSVPPISLFGLVSVALVILSTPLMSISFAPLAINAVCFGMIFLATLVTWAAYGRDILPPKAFILIIRYGFAKIRLYKAVIFGRRISRWIRADRS